MADQCLFDFLHMEIVSHVYKEQQTNKGEVDNKVRCYYIVLLQHVHTTYTTQFQNGYFGMWDLDTTAYYCLIPGMSCLQERAVCISVLENMGFRVGQGLIERYRVHAVRCIPPLNSETDLVFSPG